MRVVLDTNVIVSGLNFPGNERLVLELALRGRFRVVPVPLHPGGGCRGAWPQVRLEPRNARPRLSGRWAMPPPSLNPVGSLRRSRAATPTTASLNAPWRLPPTTWSPAIAGTCYPLRSIKAQESSTPPASCRSWKKDDTGRCSVRGEPARSPRWAESNHIPSAPISQGGDRMSRKSSNRTPHDEAVAIIEQLVTTNLGGDLEATAACNQCSEELTVNLVAGAFQRQSREARGNGAPRHQPAR